MPKRIFSEKLPTQATPVPMPQKELRHLHVLRITPQNEVIVLNGKGKSVLAQWTGMELIWLKDLEEQQALPMTLIMALVKPDAMEMVLQKATEMGVARIIPLLAERSVSRKRDVQERFTRIMEGALKQSGQLMMPHLEATRTIHELEDAPMILCSLRPGPFVLDHLLCHTEPPSFLIGPEGGWTQEEEELLIRKGGHPVSLGPTVLRAETAALFCTSLLCAMVRSDILCNTRTASLAIPQG